MYRIPECNLCGLQTALAKLAKRAVKLGLTPPALSIIGHEDIPLIERGEKIQEDKDGKLRAAGHHSVGIRRYHFADLVGEAPVVTGWELLGVIEHGDSEVGQVIRSVPGKSVPTEYRTKTGYCDHCRTNRRRLETFVCRNIESGEIKQIGRNCLADFCRSPELAADMAAMATLLASAGNLCDDAEDFAEGFGGSGRSRRVETLALLATTSNAIRAFGWMSKGKARIENQNGGNIMATAEIVSRVMFPPNRLSDADKALVRRMADVCGEVDQDTPLAEAAMEWVRSMRDQVDTLDDYLHNLLVVITDESVEDKYFGIACSAIPAYNRHLGKIEEDKLTDAKRLTMKHVGTIGNREVFQSLTVKKLAYHDGKYGVRVMAQFEDSDGNVLVWWTGDSCPWSEGETVTIKGTVKTHTQFRGLPQTVISRCTEHVEKAKKTRNSKKIKEVAEQVA